MPLGLSKYFIICVLLAVAMGYSTKNWVNGVVLVALFGVITFIWRFLTR